MSAGGRGGTDESDLAEQWRLLNADPQRVAQAHQAVRQEEAEVYELWPEFAEAWDVFQACGNTQWRILVGMGFAHFQGLDYGSVESVVNMHGIPRKQQRQLLAHVRTLEDEALKHLND